jgi:hypothetical protein
VLGWFQHLSSVQAELMGWAQWSRKRAKSIYKREDMQPIAAYLLWRGKTRDVEVWWCGVLACAAKSSSGGLLFRDRRF